MGQFLLLITILVALCCNFCSSFELLRGQRNESLLINYDKKYNLLSISTCVPYSVVDKTTSSAPAVRYKMKNEDLVSITERLGMKFVTEPEGIYPDLRPGPPELYSGDIPLHRIGFDPVCRKADIFHSTERWLRDSYIASTCRTMPRERALKYVLDKYYPYWGEASIHESSPNSHGLSEQIRNQALDYTASQYSSEIACGNSLDNKQRIKKKTRHQRLRAKHQETMSLNLEDQSCVGNDEFDIILTQDVFEHMYNCTSAFKEIERTLKPGGIHIFTTPLEMKSKGSRQVAFRQADGSILLDQVYDIHGNPMGAGGSLKTMSWGYDIVDMIKKATNMDAVVIYVESPFMGIEAVEYREVVVAQKAGLNSRLRTPFQHKFCGKDQVLKVSVENNA